MYEYLKRVIGQKIYEHKFVSIISGSTQQHSLAVTLSAFIRKVLGSNPGQETDYTDVSRGFPTSSRKIRGQCLDSATTASLQTPLQFIIHQPYHSTPIWISEI
jgi:hypothetical protein